MKVFIERKKQTINMQFTGTVNDLLKKINQNPEAVLVAVNNELVANDCKLKNSDSVKILAVVSGG
ncbi:MoaD/ThiS family protein [Candidatus Woesearchaeota archaeon]|nr:MoaD/ThiS family protein [Candidatus Woesearchaeota archaeon]